MCFGSEVPSAAGATRDSAGRPSDDFVAKIDEFGWLDDSEKSAIFHENPLRFCKAFSSLTESGLRGVAARVRARVLRPVPDQRRSAIILCCTRCRAQAARRRGSSARTSQAEGTSR